MKWTFFEFFSSLGEILNLLINIWDYMKVRRKYWLASLILTILLMDALTDFTQGSVLAPFIYTLF